MSDCNCDGTEVSYRGSAGRSMTQTLIVGLRAGHPSHTPEAEGVLVETAGGDVRLTLDDGDLLILDRDELLSALGVSPAVVGLRRAA